VTFSLRAACGGKENGHGIQFGFLEVKKTGSRVHADAKGVAMPRDDALRVITHHRKML
jgi:hypothetical protein